MKWLLAAIAAISVGAAVANPKQANAPVQSPPVKGEVVELLEAKNYTYMRLKTAKGETWAAVPKATLRKGATVTVENAMTTTSFESPSLGRKFDQIVFGTLVGAAPAAAAAAPAAPAAGMPGATGQAKANPHGGGAAPAAPIKVAKATGANAYTVAELIDGRAKLKDKQVEVRGQVVKFTGGVMGRNWIHLQDGSGSAAKSTNDVLVTTQDAARVGDVVLVKGKVGLDRDFGYGYVYPVALEEAKLQK